MVWVSGALAYLDFVVLQLLFALVATPPCSLRAAQGQLGLGQLLALGGLWE